MKELTDNEKAYGIGWWLLLGVMFGCIFLMNYYSIPSHDELSFAFAGQHTTINGDHPRVGSLSDVVWQQYGDYMATPDGRYGYVSTSANGRALSEGVVAIFSGFKFYTLFDVLNTFAFFCLVWLILKEAGVCGGSKRLSVRSYLLGCALVWWFVWYGEAFLLNAAFAVNYLWVACLTILMMRLWRNLTSWWAVPLFFLFGWTIEVYVLPMIASLAVLMVVRCVIARQRLFSAKQILAWILLLCGAGVLCCAPSAISRANATLSGAEMSLVMKVIKANKNFILMGTPVLLAVAVLFVLWAKRNAFLKMLNRSLEWWLYLGFSYGLSCLIGATNGLAHVAIPVFMTAVILLLRERDVFGFLNKKTFLCFMLLCFAWLIGSTVQQIRIGKEVQRTLSLYRQDSQGITYRRVVLPGIFQYAISPLLYNDWHWHFFRREFEHKKNPTVFTPWLYESLYETPHKFFESASQLGESGLYVSPFCPKAIVARGHVTLTDTQKAVVASYYDTLDRPVVGWKRFLPGRLKLMFPSDDFFLNIVSAEDFRFVAKDGRPYTLYLGER